MAEKLVHLLNGSLDPPMCNEVILVAIHRVIFMHESGIMPEELSAAAGIASLLFSAREGEMFIPDCGFINFNGHLRTGMSDLLPLKKRAIAREPLQLA